MCALADRTEPGRLRRVRTSPPRRDRYAGEDLAAAAADPAAAHPAAADPVAVDPAAAPTDGAREDVRPISP